MTVVIKASIASAALSIAAVLAPVNAADLGGPRGGSIKDHYVAPMPEVQRGPAGPCYFRADLGYSWSQDPTIKWPVSNEQFTTTYDDANPWGVETYNATYMGDAVSNTSMENSWLGEFGVGCGSGSRGIRGEVMFGVRGDRKIEGEPLDYTREYIYIDNRTAPASPAPADRTDSYADDPMHTSLRTYTLMLNLYKDLGNFRGITPYIGAGVGVAYHKMSDTYFTLPDGSPNPMLPNRIAGDNDITFAWSLMAGVGYQISDRAILDVGYRYIDMGKAASARHDSAGYVNPRITMDDLTAHELKVGLRYHFGQDCCAQPAAYAPMK